MTLDKKANPFLVFSDLEKKKELNPEKWKSTKIRLDPNGDTYDMGSVSKKYDVRTLQKKWNEKEQGVPMKQRKKMKWN